QKHLVHHWWLVFARWIPLLGTAYSRAREYTCDQYGLLCTHHSRSAVRALSVLAAGSQRWKKLNTEAYIAQTGQTKGFWMALNELTADYPWLCKRVARVAHGVDTKLPRRNIFAWLLAAIIPNTGFGLVGALIVYIYLSIILVPLAFMAYGSYAAKAKEAAVLIEQAPTREKLTQAYAVGKTAAELLAQHYKQKEELPQSLDELGFQNTQPAVIKAVAYDSDAAELTLNLNPPLEDKAVKLDLTLDEQGEVVWTCTVVGKVHVAALPEGCTLADSSDEDTQEATKSAPTLFEKILEKMW
ncbi:MAG: hypothetical protein V4858_23880, partial [Pseudomonadota bacterium]